MKYLDYMREHTDETLPWCSVYTDDSGEYCIAINEDKGVAETIKTPNGVTYSYGCQDFDAEVKRFAQAVNPDYDYYHGYTDIQIAIEKLHRVSCWDCPFRDACEAMAEEIVD